VAQKQVLGHQIPAGAERGSQGGEQDSQHVDHLHSMSHRLTVPREVSPSHSRWQREQLPEAIRGLVLDAQRLRNGTCWSVFDC
jgi:hypothetical protein